MRKRIHLWAVVALLMLVIAVDNAQAQQIEGTDFWWVMPSNNTNLGGSANIVVQSNYYTNVTVTFPQMTGSFSTQTVSLKPGTQSVVLLGGPQEYVGNQVTGVTSALNIFPINDAVVEKVGVHIMADSSITVYAVNHEANSMDGETVLPTTMLGTSYVVGSRQCSNYINDPARFSVGATQNNTTITIKSWSGNSDVNETFTLNAGETWTRTQNTPRGPGMDAQFRILTGSTVTSNKPVVVVGHTPCSSMMDCGACDMMMTELLPTNLWGTKYYTIEPMKRILNSCSAFSTSIASYLEIIGKPGQQITLKNSAGTYVKTIPALPFPTANNTYSYLWYDNPMIGGATNPETFGELNTVLTSTQPFAVIQYMKDFYSDNTKNTDPEATVGYPSSMWNSEYLITTITPIGSGQPDAQIIMVVDNTIPGAQNISIDGTPVNSALWQTFAGGTAAFARFPLPSVTVTHKVVSNSGINFGCYITYGDGVESYVLQGGGTQIPVARMLPIQLISFDAAIENNHTVLKWLTATEKNTSKFVVERSTDGFEYKEIGTIQAAGNSTKALSYSMIDKSPVVGENYYRLKQIDRDAHYSYSKINSILMHPEKMFAISNIAPNPTKGQIAVEYRTESAVTVSWALNDIIGRKILSGEQSTTIGLNQLNIDLSNFEKGTYFLSVHNNENDDKPVILKVNKD